MSGIPKLPLPFCWLLSSASSSLQIERGGEGERKMKKRGKKRNLATLPSSSSDQKLNPRNLPKQSLFRTNRNRPSSRNGIIDRSCVEEGPGEPGRDAGGRGRRRRRLWHGHWLTQKISFERKRGDAG
ncbi:uncharacterized protein K489DRAFT_381746 [Dissoconium aciculare CBS 342.82]|uniref:Uncharacterized protein n=1 Tax=Dissoconium aciculare CBS 342.82 TaxID=1314786 RepID=A0A6J3M1I6_9PEZI|nr:uncharacterized protein K489DRAFT_381746 [Dissoconium aciculare CBS 342.82]KAF1821753.1 hypothetical protein K489DRAFT_381746 [Dissoconium aciculare CBS 342.82]